MASITNNNSRYGEGHKVVLKEAAKMSLAAKSLYKTQGYTPGKSVFAITLKPSKIDNVIQYSSGSENVYVIDEKRKVIQLIGSASAIDGTFNHFSNNAKSNTNLLTEIKENISMWVFQEFFERKKNITEDEITNKLGINKKYYDTTYYESAVKQLDELKNYVNGGGYNYERQGGPLTKKMYITARKVTSKSSDNWNPADVWMIKKGYDMKPLYEATNAETLNGILAEAFYSRDIIPISLKNVTTAKASSSIIDPNRLMNMKLDLDLSFLKVDLSDTFANFIVQTKSGFAARVGYKASATTLNVSVEGRMIGAGYQLGAVDSKDYRNEVQSVHKYSLRSGPVNDSSAIEEAKKELKEIFDKYGRISNTLESYDQAISTLNASDKLTQDRFVNIISYLYSFLILPQSFETHIKFCYFSAKKISSVSGLYLILQ